MRTSCCYSRAGHVVTVTAVDQQSFAWGQCATVASAVAASAIIVAGAWWTERIRALGSAN